MGKVGLRWNQHCLDGLAGQLRPVGLVGPVRPVGPVGMVGPVGTVGGRVSWEGAYPETPGPNIMIIYHIQINPSFVDKSMPFMYNRNVRERVRNSCNVGPYGNRVLQYLCECIKSARIRGCFLQRPYFVYK